MRIPTLNRWLPAVVLLGVAVLSCYRDWPEAGDFQEQLRCGMSLDELNQLAERFDVKLFGLHSTRDGKGADCYLRNGGETFEFWFSGPSLEWFRRGRMFGFRDFRQSLRVSLCTQERTGHLVIHVSAPSELDDAAVVVDGRVQGTIWGALGSKATRSFALPLLSIGAHEIRIEKEGFEPIVREFEYRPEGFWPKATTIDLVVKDSELVRDGDGVLDPVDKNPA